MHQEKVLQTLESGVEFLKATDPQKALAELRGEYTVLLHPLGSGEPCYTAAKQLTKLSRCLWSLDDVPTKAGTVGDL